MSNLGVMLSTGFVSMNSLAAKAGGHSSNKGFSGQRLFSGRFGSVDVLETSCRIFLRYLWLIPCCKDRLEHCLTAIINPYASAAHSVGDGHSQKYGLKTIPAIIIEGKIKIMYLIFLWLRLGLYKTYKKNIAATTNTLPFLLSSRCMANSIHSYSKLFFT